MSILLRLVGCIGLVLLLMTEPRSASGQGPAAPTQYLMFQIFTASPGFTTEADKHVITRLPDQGFFDAEAKKILDFVGERGDGQHRLGIIVGPLALDHTDAQLRTLIEWTFAIASKYKIAVGLHIDDSKFWLNRRDLWSNAANVEWLDWQGTPNTGQYLNWGGGPWKLAPQACFNSPAMIAEARRVAGRVIGPAIAEQLAKLRRDGDEALFAGVIVGWETAIGRDFETRRDLGYCALANLDFSAAAPPPDRDRELEGVVRNWIGTWAKSLADSGIPADKLYSHIAFKSRREFDAETHGSTSRSYAQDVMYSPPTVAFSDAFRPGFSTYPDAYVIADIYAALAAHGNPPWASSEGANVDIQVEPPSIPDAGMEAYLAHMFNHGAVIANLFGGDIGDAANPFRRAVEGEASADAYRKFLRGARLEERPLSEYGHPALTVLQNRLRALPGLIERYLHAGGDPHLIQPQVERLERDLKDGRLDAGRRQLDLIESMIGGVPP